MKRFLILALAALGLFFLFVRARKPNPSSTPENVVNEILDNALESQYFFRYNYELRGEDSHGSGAFGAKRGDRTHQGLDLKYAPNQPFRIPFECVFIRRGQVYRHDSKYRLMEFKGLNQYKNLKMKVMYLFSNG